MQNSFAGLDNLCKQVIKTMKLWEHDTSLRLIVAIDAEAFTNARFYSNTISQVE